MRNVYSALTIAFLLVVAGCAQSVEPFSPAHIDRSISQSGYPLATEPSLVGRYSGNAKSGAGYFYDEVLEYRVWMDPDDGAAHLAGSGAYFAAFAQYENALAYSKATKGAEPPLVLIRQVESVNEPSPGVFEWDRTERTTEWQVQWLQGAKRGPASIPAFLKAHQAPAAGT